MSDIKSTVSRVHTGRPAAASGASGRHAPHRANVDIPSQIQKDKEAYSEKRIAETPLLSEFIAPPTETAEWLGSPSIGSVLTAVSGDLAPGGMATSKRNQYVASVVETHLVARRQLAKHLNSLLRA